MLLSVVRAFRRLSKPVCPKNTLRGHVWLAFDRFVQTWENRGFARSVVSAWGRRIRPLYRPYSRVPDNLFVSRSIRTHNHRIGPHTERVDIVVCVHDALEDVRNCLSSVVRHTRPPYGLIIVDDGSGPETSEFLAAWSREQGANLLRHDIARGYTCAANAGLRASTAGKVVLLNSDTLVTPLWLDRLVACADSSKNIGMVGPLSNAASWQSVPQVFDAAGDWKENDLPGTCDLRTMAVLIGKSAAGVYPRVPFLNGFCLLVKREVLDNIGVFDEENFGAGYGEENDYAVRARKAGWMLAIADDAYVWHRQSRSYSHERRKQLSSRAQEKLVSLHGEAVFEAGTGFYNSDLSILSIRARAGALWERSECVREGMRKYEGRRILFVLPTSRPGGGSHVIVQEARALQRMGVDVRLFNLSMNKEGFQRAYPEITVPILYGHGLDDLARLVPGFDAVVATLYSSVDWIAPERIGSPDVVRGYYIQDYEPWFFEAGSTQFDEAVASYSRIPGMVRLTKTEWNRRVVLEQTGQDCAVVGPSVDLDAFYPRQQRKASGALAISAMIRPETSRRSPELTMRVLQAVSKLYGQRVEVTLFGCERDTPLCKRFKGSFPYNNLGVITRTDLADALSRTDLFVDLSAYQAMGMTAMEAMASGAAVILPQTGGASSFAKHGENAWMVDTASESHCHDAVKELVNDPGKLQALRAKALADICKHHPESVALRILGALFGDVATEERH